MNISTQYKIMVDGAVNAGISYLRGNPGIKALIIGMSGGVDSAVVAALARKICDAVAKEGRKIDLSGYCLPIQGNEPDEIKRADAVGKEYCDTFTTVDLSETFVSLLCGIDYPLYAKYTMHNAALTHEEKVRLGNVKARTRMIFLYNKAQEQKGLVLSTDNFTEYLLGFWTLHGDVGDLGLIQELWKTEVYGMADLLGGSALLCASAIPTDGLGITNSDIDQLIPTWTSEMGDHRAAYAVVDDVLDDHVSKLGAYSESNPVIQRYRMTGFKRKNPVNIKRDMLLWIHSAVQ